MATAQVPEQSSLTENTQADVCIVGAGIAGMTTAYLLARQGRSVSLGLVRLGAIVMIIQNIQQPVCWF